MRGRRWGLVCGVGAFTLDQATKEIVLSSPEIVAGIEVMPAFNLVLVRNSGVSFGMLSGTLPPWGLSLLSLMIVAALAVWLWHSPNRLMSIALGLLIGGALANVLDRIRHGAVTDFLDFHLAGYHWPAFNFADVAVVGAVALLFLHSLRESRTGRSPKPSKA